MTVIFFSVFLFVTVRWKTYIILLRLGVVFNKVEENVWKNKMWHQYGFKKTKAAKSDLTRVRVLRGSWEKEQIALKKEGRVKGKKMLVVEGKGKKTGNMSPSGSAWWPLLNKGTLLVLSDVLDSSWCGCLYLVTMD